MVQLSVTAKGQITLKKNVLEHMNIKPGDKVDVELMPGGKIMLDHGMIRTSTVADLAGFLPNKTGRSFSIEEINEAIAASWAGEE
jgi:AbrB family looped-hinge helix DNA binding protein